MGRRCFSAKGGGKDCFGKGELPDGAQILALEDVERGEAGGKAVALGGGSREKMEGSTGFGDGLRWGGNHGVVDGRMDGESFFPRCLFRRRMEDGRRSDSPNAHGSSGYSFSHVGCGGGGEPGGQRGGSSAACAPAIGPPAN